MAYALFWSGVCAILNSYPKINNFGFVHERHVEKIALAYLTLKPPSRPLVVNIWSDRPNPAIALEIEFLD
jgi:hypothetical protein